ncbi:hypothetical protein EDF35_1948 [Rathayibacter sp. PhB151]|uniref:hypothetical protein n=1 Tax=Rathayibacter sp. PhB151 TaxID=2485189 RepID=UPI001063C8F6|nr:hypothetical protein [Rathayibacter sp. PhB151]TDX78734.1 hypothetical protein EDF35_1948 [Rathayibacter sp. PhB151]
MSTTEPTVALIPKSPQEVTKAILVIAVTLFASIRASLGGGIVPVEGLQLIIQAVTLVPVFFLTGTAVKTAAAFGLAGLQALVVPFSVLVGWNAWASISFDDWAGAIIAAFLAIGIAVVPNSPPKIDAKQDPAGVYNITSLTVATSDDIATAAAALVKSDLDRTPGPDHRRE